MSVYADWFTSANFGWFLLSTFGLMLVLVGLLAYASAREQEARERAAGGEPVPGGCPPSPGTVLARQVHPTRGLSDDVCRRICTELEGQFVEDDTARRTTLNREDGQ